MNVMRRPGGVSMLVLLAAVAARAGYAAPVAAVARVQAADCCARHCDHRGRPVRPDDCCQVVTQATEAVAVTATRELRHPGLVLPVSVPTRECADIAPARSSTGVPGLGRGGPPLFLATCSLRL